MSGKKQQVGFIARNAHEWHQKTRTMLATAETLWPVSVTLEPYRSQRTLAQNRLFWMWMQELQDHILEATGELHSKDTLHDFFCQELLEPDVKTVLGKIVHRQRGTSGLKIGEFANFLERVEYIAQDRFFCVLTHPDDLYWDALKKEVTDEKTD